MRDLLTWHRLDFFLFQTGSQDVTLVDLELTLLTRQALQRSAFLCLTVLGEKAGPNMPSLKTLSLGF